MYEGAFKAAIDEASGRLRVNEYHQLAGYTNVFACGDCALNPTAEPFRSAVDLTLLGLSGGGSWQLRDVWNRKDAGAVSGTIAFDVPPTDSQFFLLSASSS